MYSTSIKLTRAWLTDPINDPGGASVVAGSRQTQEASHAVDGEFRVYAGGVIRPVLRVTSARLYPVQLITVTPADVAQLDTWIGSVLLLRTADGQRKWGSYLSFTIARVNFATLADGSSGTFYDVTLTFTEVTPFVAVP